MTKQFSQLGLLGYKGYDNFNLIFNRLRLNEHKRLNEKQSTANVHKELIDLQYKNSLFYFYKFIKRLLLL